MALNLPSNSKFYLCKYAVDLRRSFDGLIEVVEKFFPNEIKKSSFFIFMNASKNRVKILYWDKDGVVIWYKKLESGKHFKGIFNQEEEDQEIDVDKFLNILESSEKMKPI